MFILKEGEEVTQHILGTLYKRSGFIVQLKKYSDVSFYSILDTG